MADTIIGLDVGGTKTAVVEGTTDAQILQRTEIPTEAARAVDAFNPQMIVLGALAVVLGERILAPARGVPATEALPQAVAACEILPSVPGKTIGDVASLTAALFAAAPPNHRKF